MKDPHHFYLPWIDWMKAIGMFVIVLGHFGGDFTVYLYVFSVPLFFFLSGFLISDTPIGGGNYLWIRKLSGNLLVPMTLICLLTLCIKVILSVVHHRFESTLLLQFIPDFILGMHPALINMWFVYTLIILKLIRHFCHLIKYLPLILLIVLPSLGWFVDSNYQIESCALLNTTMAYPFFYIGYRLREFKMKIHAYKNGTLELICFLLCGLIVYLCGKYNGFVWMFCNEFGKNFALFLLGGMAGTCGILIISKWLSAVKSSIITTIARGTIIILGFHLYFIYAAKRLFGEDPLSEFLSAFAIMMIFVPIIFITEKYFPVIIGKYRIKRSFSSK